MVWRHFKANTGMEPQNNPKVVKSPLPFCTKLSDEKKSLIYSPDSIKKLCILQTQK